jgi:hypothetical protein
MSNENVTPTTEGWKPGEPMNKGYQPVSPPPVPIDGGYQPTSQGNGPANQPTPPGPE